MPINFKEKLNKAKLSIPLKVEFLIKILANLWFSNLVLFFLFQQNHILNRRFHPKYPIFVFKTGALKAVLR